MMKAVVTIASIFAGLPALAGTSTYSCVPKYRADNALPFTVQVAANEAYVTVSGFAECSMSLDSTYRPTRYKNYDRYTSAGCEGVGDSIRLPKTFRNGAESGIGYMDVAPVAEGMMGDQAITYRCALE